MDKEILAQLDRIERNSLLLSKNVLTFNDLALFTGMAKSTLYKLTSKGEIPFYRPTGKHLYFDKAEIENWLKTNKQTSK